MFLLVLMHGLPVNGQVIDPFNRSDAFNAATKSYQDPSYLMMRDQARPVQLILGNAHFQLDRHATRANAPSMANALQRLGSRFYPGSFPLDTGQQSRAAILETYFPDGAQHHHGTASYDVLLLGVSLHQPEHAWSLGFRARGFNTYELSRGWFETAGETGSEHDPMQLERTLQHRQVNFYKLSFGYARNLEMLSNWMPGLNRFYVGIRPKLLLGGPFFQASFDPSQPHSGGGVLQADPGPEAEQGQTDDHNNLMTGGGSLPWGADNLADTLPARTPGYGAGFDFGFTYVQNLGDDLSLRDRTGEPIGKSLSLHAALTDLGSLFYDGASQYRIRPEDATAENGGPDEPARFYSGHPTDFMPFLRGDQQQALADTRTDMLDETARSGERYTYILPAAIRLGSELRWSALRVGLSWNYVLQRGTFQQGDWHASADLEVHPFSFILLNGGVEIVDRGQPAYRMGGGIDAGRFRIATTVRFRVTESRTLHPLGLHTGSLHLRF